MGRHSSFPKLIDECNNINISKLKGWGYLLPNGIKQGMLTWKIRGEVVGCIMIEIRMLEDMGIMTLDYNSNNVPVNYKVQITSKPSNLGKGLLWFFICPNTGKICRKLHLSNSYFYHRTAFKDCLYETQTYGKRARDTKKAFDRVFKAEHAYEKIYSKHFKKFYKGKITKQYLRQLKEIEERQSITISQIERMILK
ncbi:hypothetical protein [uncultured Mucilaginibacter sp.]|uniref:hypothetical protein n=1 Tax=uncultured Mucilaginibacter sp. TaxID=797541 RepID=UPI0025FED9DD|nr:hypothetical protein [uncultured Mucilaginibacter sp.]